MDFHVYFHQVDTDGAVLNALKTVAGLLQDLKKQIADQGISIHKEFQMADKTLQDIADEVAQETSIGASISTMVTALLAKAAAVPGLTPEQQTQINDIAQHVADNITTFQTALSAGTGGLAPQPPTVTVPPVQPPTDPASSST